MLYFVVVLQLFIRAGYSGTARSKAWWAYPRTAQGEASVLPTLRDEGLVLLIQILQLKQPAAYKCMTLAGSTLWYAALDGCIFSTQQHGFRDVVDVISVVLTNCLGALSSVL